MTEETQRPGSRWNSAAYIFARIDTLKVRGHESRLTDDLRSYYRSLEGLFVEIFPRMTDDEKKNLRKTLNYLYKNLKTILEARTGSLISQDIYDDFLNFELELSVVMERERMNMPDQLDDFDE